jgi:hypothetical protein
MSHLPVPREAENNGGKASFQAQYPNCPAGAVEQLWFSRSASATYRAQILPVFGSIRELGVAV